MCAGVRAVHCLGGLAQLLLLLSSPSPSARALRPVLAQESTNGRRRFAPICYDFVKNQCMRGENCRYSHDYTSILLGHRRPGKNPNVLCVDFTRGRCLRGNACRYSHTAPVAMGPGGQPLAGPGLYGGQFLQPGVAPANPLWPMQAGPAAFFPSGEHACAGVGSRAGVAAAGSAGAGPARPVVCAILRPCPSSTPGLPSDGLASDGHADPLPTCRA